MLCLSLEYPFDTDIYCSKNGEADTSEPLGSSVVLSAWKCVSVPTDHSAFMDNFFTSQSFLQELKHRGFRATGTVREEKLKKCPLENAKFLSRKECGELDMCCDEEICAACREINDNGCVCVATNYDSVYLMVKTTRSAEHNAREFKCNSPN